MEKDVTVGRQGRMPAAEHWGPGRETSLLKSGVMVTVCINPHWARAMVSAGAHIMPPHRKPRLKQLLRHLEGLGSMKWRISSGRWAPASLGSWLCPPGWLELLSSRAEPRQAWSERGQCSCIKVQPSSGSSEWPLSLQSVWGTPGGFSSPSSASLLAHFFLSSIFPTSLSLRFSLPLFLSFLACQPAYSSASSTHSPLLSFLPFPFPAPLRTSHLPTPLPFLNLLLSFLSLYVCASVSYALASFASPFSCLLSCSLFSPFASSLFLLLLSLVQIWQEVTFSWPSMAEPPALSSPKTPSWVDLHTDLVMKMCVRKLKLQKVLWMGQEPRQTLNRRSGLHPKSAWYKIENGCVWGGKPRKPVLTTDSVTGSHVSPQDQKEGCSHKLSGLFPPPWGLIDSNIAWLYSGIFLDAKDTEPRDLHIKLPFSRG